MIDEIKRKLYSEKYYTHPHPKLKSKRQQNILRCFAADFTATQTASIVDRDVRTINPIYQWLRGVIANHHSEFLRFQEYDINYELVLLLSQSAMVTMYWYDTDQASMWDNHTLLLRGNETDQQASIAELLRRTFADEQQFALYEQHINQNRDWLMQHFISHRMKRLRTRMADNNAHVMENIYRFLIAAHVLWHNGMDTGIEKAIKGRHIGSGETLEKAGVLHIDRLFEQCAFQVHAEVKASIIFSDLMHWLHQNPHA